MPLPSTGPRPLRLNERSRVRASDVFIFPRRAQACDSLTLAGRRSAELLSDAPPFREPALVALFSSSCATQQT